MNETDWYTLQMIEDAWPKGLTAQDEVWLISTLKTEARRMEQMAETIRWQRLALSDADGLLTLSEDADMKAWLNSRPKVEAIWREVQNRVQETLR